MILTTAIVFASYAFAHPNCMADVIESTQHLRKRSGVEFTHDNAAEWDQEFATCAGVPGNYQSPIDLSHDITTSPAHKIQWGNTLQSGTFKDTGHGLQVDIPASDTSFKLENNGLIFNMAQFHFHSPSEHSQFSQSYDLEVHFVHKSESGVLAVQGIWFQLSDTLESKFLKSLLVNGVPLHKNDSMPVSAIDFTEPIQALGGNSSWAYLGSLTTPPCTGDVRWTISKAIVPISKAQLDLINSADHGLPGNSRPVTNKPTDTSVVPPVVGRKCTSKK
jgi:carbonic anhydrase